MDATKAAWKVARWAAGTVQLRAEQLAGSKAASSGESWVEHSAGRRAVWTAQNWAALKAVRSGASSVLSRAAHSVE